MQQGRRRAQQFAVALGVSIGLVVIANRMLWQAGLSRKQRSCDEISYCRGQMLDAIKRGDAVACADFYARDAVIRTFNGHDLRGAHAVARALQETLTHGTFSTVSANAARSLYNNVIVESGSYAFGFSRPLDDHIQFEGRFVAIWKREASRWKLFFEAVQPERS